MEKKTLHEVCEALQVKRRAIQGYEKAGLVSCSDRNKYGHLLYDEQAQKRIETIKFYQQLGLSIKEICAIIDADRSVVRAMLIRQIHYLINEKKEIEDVIKKAYELLDELS